MIQKQADLRGGVIETVCVSGFNGGGVSWWVPAGEVITDSLC